MKVLYPNGGIANILNDITDLCNIYIDGKKKIIVNTSAQPNSVPHIGSLITIMCAFAFALRLSQKYSIEANVQFDELENSTGKEVNINNNKYVLALDDVLYDDIITKAEKNMNYYIDIMARLKLLSNINYYIRTYKEYQSIPLVRKSMVDIFNDYDYFTELLNPNDKKLHVRMKCSECGLLYKSYEKYDFTINRDNVILYYNCPIHGRKKIIISENSIDYFDMNTQLRDLTKGVLFSNFLDSNILPIMFDGNDWSGVWCHRVHCQGLSRLGYQKMPLRLFSPLITDWSGAKFSKSLYVQVDAYNYLKDRGIDNYENFIDTYGEKGFVKLWYEVNNWCEKPTKFFRNYSIDYILKILNDGV